MHLPYSLPRVGTLYVSVPAASWSGIDTTDNIIQGKVTWAAQLNTRMRDYVVSYHGQ